MGNIRIPSKVKLFAGMFSADISNLDKAKTKLARRFGAIDYESPVLDFSHTNYYRQEFGSALKRQFVGFARHVDTENIYKAKIATNRSERSLSCNNKRTVNIDPGYLTLSKVVLLTTKDYTHRIYLAGGIYAEVTLHYKSGTFNPWDWTYPDYKTPEYVNIFNHIRDIYNKEGGKVC
ncbi:MAG: DUF4416 family protein [Candidatus Omnitrophica bacterium]|nr:DUF4416 family protein [Candidatus Omnitrophota bacterium]